MSEPRSVSFKNEDEELLLWCDQNIGKGNLSDVIIKKLYEYKEEKTKEIQLNKTNNFFQMFMFLFLGITFLLLAIAPFIDILSILTTSLLIFYSIMLFIYTFIQYKNKKKVI